MAEIISKKFSLSEFQDIVDKNWEKIIQGVPHNPSISADDEWNNPVYDKYSQADVKGDDRG